MNNDISVAISIVGFPRNYKKTLNSFIDKVLEKNRLADLYIVTYSNMFSPEILEMLKPYCSDVKIKLIPDEDYSHESNNPENTLYKKYPVIFNEMCKIKNKNMNTYRIMARNFIPQFHQMKIVKRMIEDSKKKYDLVVKTRFDVLYEDDIEFGELFSLTEDRSIGMPDLNFAYRYSEVVDNGYTKRVLKTTEYGNVNDVFLFGYQKNMLDYFDAIDLSLSEMFSMNLRKTESYVGYHIRKKLGLKTNHISNKMGLYRKMSERLE
jgi:hypothetical protein